MTTRAIDSETGKQRTERSAIYTGFIDVRRLRIHARIPGNFRFWSDADAVAIPRFPFGMP
jgi:hypothetical protein